MVAPETGFTLIEVLFSVFLVALISGVLFACFFLPQREISSAKSELVRTEEAAVFLGRLSEEITAAYPGEKSFSGKKDSIAFLSSAGTDLGLEKIHYAVKTDDSTGTDTTVYRWSGLPYQAEEDGADRPVLQAESLVFGYYDGKEWSEEWSGKGIPLLVSVALSRKGKSFQVLCGLRAGVDSDTGAGGDAGAGGG
jgi:type II secretory pathway component PulJ